MNTPFVDPDGEIACFCDDNTQINIDFRALSTTPYTPQSQKTFITIYYAIACIVVIIGIVALVIVLTLP